MGGVVVWWCGGVWFTNGKLRIRIDPQLLNAALKREHYQLPVLDDVLPKLKGAVRVTAVQFILYNFTNYSPSIAMELKVNKEITCE